MARAGFLLPVLVLNLLLRSVAGGAEGEPLAVLAASVPRAVADLSDEQTERLHTAAGAVEGWAAELHWDVEKFDPQQVLTVVRQVIEAKEEVDRALEQVLALRTAFHRLPDDDHRRQILCAYLRSTAQLIDLSGRLRSLLRDLIDAAVMDLGGDPEPFHGLLQLLTEKQLSIGAVVMSYMLFDPAPETGAPAFPPEDKLKALRLIAASRSADLLPWLAAYLRHEQHPALLVYAAELVRYLGLPQKPRPGADPSLPAPPILGEELYQRLSRLEAGRLNPTMAARRQALLDWLQPRIARGETGESYWIGSYAVRAGDWLLMRNPSPYNRFTDLSPGLFTHVGVVGVEEGTDGIRRFVIVDLPERGERVPATTVDTYLQRTLHYFFVRHRDPAVAAKMGQAAVDMIGNETQFDLTFRTSRVAELQGRPLRGALIHTYCAGFLLLCAQAAGVPRGDVFPISEAAAAGNTRENLATMGLSIGEDFISPTGAVFAPQLTLVGRREPMYDPAREVQETIYDHFAAGMLQRKLQLSPDAYQELRLRLAELSKANRWLAQALARAGGVSERLDLEAAAKAATVIETLDAIADQNVAGFDAAQRALLATSASADAAAPTAGGDQQPPTEAYRQQHAQLFQAWQEGRLTPRELRANLVQFYVDRGQRQVDERFFP